MPREWNRGEYLISTDAALLDVAAIHPWLSRDSYWARGISREVLEKAIRHSLCYGIYKGREQAGFGRLLTDYATFGYLCDVFVLPVHRGLGLSKWLVECIVTDPEFAGFRGFALFTKDAQGLYARFGFENPKDPATVMRLIKEDPYGVSGAGREGMSMLDND